MMENIRNRLGIDVSIRYELYALIILFSFLLVAMILSTGISVWDHAGEDAEIEVVNHQRVLLSKTTAFFSGHSGEESDLAKLLQTFEQNLSALKDGGYGVTADEVVKEVPSLHQGLLQDQLAEIINAWPDYRARLEAIHVLPDNDPTRTLQEEKAREEYLILAGHLDSIFIGLEKHMGRDHRLLLYVQLAGLFLALPLIQWGSNIIHYRIIRPLDVLHQATVQFGQGDSSSSLSMDTQDEFADLACSFEEMRSEIVKNKQILEDQVSNRTRELSVAFEFSQEITGHLEFEALIQKITESASRLMQSERISLCLLREDGRNVEMYANHRGILTGRRPIQSVDRVREVISGGLLMDAPLDDLACKFLSSKVPTRCLSTPMRIGDRVMGALCVLRDPGQPYDENEKRALSLMANSAAIAIENARLVAEWKLQEKRNAILAERQRLASELHDHLAQTLNLANLKVDQAKTLVAGGKNAAAQDLVNEAGRNLDVAIGQVRGFMGEMIFPEETLEASDFTARLCSNMEVFEEATGIPVEVKGIEMPFDQLSTLTQKQLLMIIGEALTNIRRHAEAGRVVINFSSDAESLYATIEDDGKGFDTDAQMGSVHLGTRIMGMRVERVGGRIHIESSIGRGTRVELSLPFSSREE